MSEVLRRRMQELLDAEPPDAALRARVISSLPDRQHGRSGARWQWLQGTVAALLAVTIVASLFYVGWRMREQQPVSPPEITITETDSGCTLGGSDVVPAGTVSMRLVNSTNDSLHVDVFLLFDNHRYGELAAFVADEQRRIRMGDSTIGPPDYAGKVAENDVPPEASLGLKATLPTGSYGVVCVQFQPNSPTDPISYGTADHISIVGPITVTRP